MNYFAHINKELLQVGIQEGGLAIYTGTTNPRQPGRLRPDAASRSASRNAYVYLWQNGGYVELDAQFGRDSVGLDVLEVQAGEEKYIFLRDCPSGYIRQTAGPAAPIVVANFGATPLRMDTLLGKFTVHAGTMLRLDESAPRREKKKVLLTVSSQYKRPLKSAELWDGAVWRRLNIREELVTNYHNRNLAVLDSDAIVQYMTAYGERGILMMDAPEPDPDYEIYVTPQSRDEVTLRFNRTDYRGGQVVQRERIISGSWGEPVIYDIQKLRESQTQRDVDQCAAELPGTLGSLVEGEPCPALSKRTRPLISDNLRAFLEDENKPGGPPDETVESGQDGYEEEPRTLAEILRALQAPPEGPAPEPAEDFPV